MTFPVRSPISLTTASGMDTMVTPLFLSKKCHEAHEIDQRNVLNAKMYVVGAKNHCFVFRGPKVVKIGQK